jgi:hypothetical protein
MSSTPDYLAHLLKSKRVLAHPPPFSGSGCSVPDTHLAVPDDEEAAVADVGRVDLAVFV